MRDAPRPCCRGVESLGPTHQTAPRPKSSQEFLSQHHTSRCDEGNGRGPSDTLKHHAVDVERKDSRASVAAEDSNHMVPARIRVTTTSREQAELDA